MKGNLSAVVLGLASAAYASSEVHTDYNLIGVRCEARNARDLIGTGFGSGGNYQEACNRAAASAFTVCSGQSYDGLFPACTSGGGWRDGMDGREDFEREPLDANWRSCIAHMYCRIVGG